MIKNLPANAGDTGDTDSMPELGRSPGGGYGNPLQYACWANTMERGAWWTTVHGVAKRLLKDYLKTLLKEVVLLSLF